MKASFTAFCRLLSATALIGLSSQGHAVDLMNNGGFGSATYGANGTSVISPYAKGWFLTKGPSTSVPLQTQVIEPSCVQFNCYSGTARIWACPSGTDQLELTTTDIKALTPDTRYRLSFHAFKNISGVPTSTPNYSVPGDASVSLGFNSNDTNYVVKDFKFWNFTYGDYNTEERQPNVIEFVTPQDYTIKEGSITVTNMTSTSKLSFRWSGKDNVKMCITAVKLEPVVEPTPDTRLIVNTSGYATLSNKVATLAMPKGTAPNAISGYKWRLYSGNYTSKWLSSTVYSYTTNYYAVTIANGYPTKDSSGNYILQKNSDGTPKVVYAGHGGGMDMGKETPFPTTAALVDDKDTDKLTYTVDFSSYGKSTTTVTAPLNLKAAPTVVKGYDGNNYYTLSETTRTGGSPAYDQPYWLEVVDASNKQIAKSAIFSIKPPYQTLKAQALNTFYHQRSGVDINPQNSFGYALEDIARKHLAGHSPDKAQCWANTSSKLDLQGNDWGSTSDKDNCKGYKPDVSGGWYDAADHGKYVVNGGVTLWTLQNMIERLQNKLQLTTTSTATKAQINAFLPSLMAEAKVEMDWMFKMQAPNDFRMKVPLGYQAFKQDKEPNYNLPYGPTGGKGVYQTDFQNKPLSSSATGVINFGGGTLPLLKIKLDLTDANVGGMVFQAVHDDIWTDLPLNPANDTRPRVLMYPTTAATLNFAAVAAQCSRIWKSTDIAMANKCYDQAVIAWKAAKDLHDAKQDIFRYEYTNENWTNADSSSPKRNTPILQYGFALNPLFLGGGAYGDLRVRDEFYWAAKELYLAADARSVSNPMSYMEYLNTDGFKTNYSGQESCAVASSTSEPIQCYGWISGFDWQNTSPLGTLSALTYKNGALATQTARDNLTAAANVLVTRTNSQGFRFTKLAFAATNRDSHYEWGSNGGVLNRAVILGAAYEVQTDPAKKQEYLDAIVQSMGYLMGRNIMEKSFISGYGNNPLSNPHHRWFAKHADVNYPKVPPGYISGGPNTRDIPALRATAPRDAQGNMTSTSGIYFDNAVVSKCMNENAVTTPSYIAQTCYSDDYRNFATNEVAINWQAPLVWVSQFLSEIYTY